MASSHTPIKSLWQQKLEIAIIKNSPTLDIKNNLSDMNVGYVLRQSRFIFKRMDISINKGERLKAHLVNRSNVTANL